MYTELVISKTVIMTCNKKKYVGMAVGNKVHKQVRISLQHPMAYETNIVSHNHPYVSSCKPDYLTRVIRNHIPRANCSAHKERLTLPCISRTCMNT